MKILALFLFWKLYKSVWSGYSVVRCPIESKMVFTDSCTVRLNQTLTVTLRCGSGVVGASVCKTYIREWRANAVHACGYFADKHTEYSM